MTKDKRAIDLLDVVFLLAAMRALNLAEVSTESQGMVVSRRHLCNARGLPKRKYS